MSIYFLAVGLWYPPWSGGNGCSSLHRPYRPGWDRSVADQPVSPVFFPPTNVLCRSKVSLLKCCYTFFTSFHLDHCGALPWFLQKTSFKGRTFMTHATKAIYRWLLSDYVKVRWRERGLPVALQSFTRKTPITATLPLPSCSNISADDMLYTETDLEESMDKIETINFHEVKEVAGIKFWCYHAGHVLGAAMFMIEIAGVKVTSPVCFFLWISNFQRVLFICIKINCSFSVSPSAAAVHRRLLQTRRQASDGGGDS